MRAPDDARAPRSRAARWTRRGFIGAGVLATGALVVGVAVRPGNPVERLKPVVAGGPGEELVNSWVMIDADNVVTAIVPHSEMGQGAVSVLGQMLADELDVDWSMVRVREAPADGNYVSPDMLRALGAEAGLPIERSDSELFEPTWDGLFTQIAKLADGYVTGGSTSVRGTGQNSMRVAGAAARQMLIAAAAQEWGVPSGEITTASGMLTHARSGNSASYARFAAAAAQQDLPSHPRLKAADEFRLMGRSLERKDIPAKVDGTALFGIDGGPDGVAMKYAAVRGAPVPGAEIAGFDAAAARAMPGVVDVIQLDNAVAVVADGYWQAQQALRAISIDYAPVADHDLDSDTLFARFSAALDEAGAEGGSERDARGDAAQALADAASVIEAEYKVPFLAHAAMEPMNCTAWVRDGACDIWTGTQVPLMARSQAAEGAGLDADQVTMHNVYMGGGFGGRLRPEYVQQAARLSRETGHPVKMIWSREEDVAQDAFRPADISRFTGGIDRAGRAVAWNNVHCSQDGPGDAPLIEHYDIPNFLVRTVEADMHLPIGSWRSVAHSQHGFFVESFMDELAHAAGADPFEFRRSHLAGAPRHRTVLERAAQMAGWGSDLPEGHGRGIALVKSFNTIVAEVAEVDMTSGRPRVRKVFCCVDPGFAMNPDGLAAQMESAIVFGLTAALFGEITIREGGVVQSNFHDYPMLRMDDAPEIAVAIVNGAPDDIGGGGEPGLPPAAPAVANAIFAASGQRVRELPILKQFA